MSKIILLLALVGIIWFALRVGGAVNKARRNFEDRVNDYMGSENRTEYVHRNVRPGFGNSREKDITDQVRVVDENDAPKS